MSLRWLIALFGKRHLGAFGGRVEIASFPQATPTIIAFVSQPNIKSEFAIKFSRLLEVSTFIFLYF